MCEFNIDVAGSGAVLLGSEFVCDGFHRERPVRVQTHVHDDHMLDFDTSKGLQDVYMSKPTHQLLLAEFDADLHVRSNVLPLDYASPVEIGRWRLKLISSGHMLGAAQVLVERDDGLRLGYSGDFHWPIDEAIRCDELVVDSTYGSPRSVRKYRQEDAELALHEIIVRSIPHGPVFLKAHRGTLHRALRLLSDLRACTFVGSARLAKELEVYASFGYPLPPIVLDRSPEGRAALRGNRCIRLVTKGDTLPVDPPANSTTIVLSAYMTNGDEPLIQRSEHSYSVALSDHADFAGTVEYVAATGAKRVLTDNTRTAGEELARELRTLLGVAARASHNQRSLEWGL
ncbi:MAG: hypothetical protein QM765_19930 [Myxococcales bacterium]